MGDRSRSKSPYRRDESARPRKTGGFRWKDKRRDDDSRDSRRLERGYRDRDRSQSPRRHPEGDRYLKNSGDNRERRRSDGYREDVSRDGRRLERGYRDRDRSQSPRRHPEGDRYLKNSGDNREDVSRDGRRLERDYRDRDRDRSPRRFSEGDRNERGSRDNREQRRSNRDADTPESRDKEAPKEKKEKKVKKVISKSSEPMIVVHVNDRLGTKAAIPCLASDPIKLFKAYVAARIGREAHEILLKRQGERPFKNQLTLEDYGVSNGVQLDLEVGTGE